MPERLQYDSVNLNTDPIRLVFDKYGSGDINAELGTQSIIHVWLNNARIDLNFENAKVAKGVYDGLKMSRVEVKIENAETRTITEE